MGQLKKKVKSLIQSAKKIYADVVAFVAEIKEFLKFLAGKRQPEPEPEHDYPQNVVIPPIKNEQEIRDSVLKPQSGDELPKPPPD